MGTTFFLAFVLAALAAVNIAGVRKGTALNVTATVAKIVPLFLLVLAGPFFVRPAHLVWAEAPDASTLSRTSILLIFAFSGVESALAPSGEVKDPARTVPRAIFVAILGVTALYVALQLVAQGVLGPELGSSPTPLADAAGRMFGPVGRTVLLAGATVSMFGYVSGMTLAVPRALFAFARDGFLPRPLAAVHPRFRTPHVAIAVQSAVIWALAVTGTFERLAILANLSALVLYAACCLAAWRLRVRDVRAGGTPFRVPGAAAAPILASLVILWMLTSIRAVEWAALGAALGVALIVFLATARARARRS